MIVFISDNSNISIFLYFRYFHSVSSSFSSSHLILHFFHLDIVRRGKVVYIYAHHKPVPCHRVCHKKYPPHGKRYFSWSHGQHSTSFHTSRCRADSGLRHDTSGSVDGHTHVLCSTALDSRVVGLHRVSVDAGSCSHTHRSVLQRRCSDSDDSCRDVHKGLHSCASRTISACRMSSGKCARRSCNKCCRICADHTASSSDTSSDTSTDELLVLSHSIVSPEKKYSDD